MNILIGICSTREDKRFLESFNKFWEDISYKHNVTVTWQYNRFLPDAQNAIADIFLDGNFDYLLFLDDDQWGHTPEMLECLINANTYVATIKTYCRTYPYFCAAFNKLDNNSSLSIENGDGYIECDFTGFPMTLIRRDTFKFLEKPYFIAVKDGERDWHTDVKFFDRLREHGIKPKVCFQYTLNHDKITQENVLQYREKERFENNNPGLYQLLKSIGA